MSPLQIGVLGGMISAAGLVLGVAALRPGAPRLSLVLAQLNVAAPVAAESTGAGQPTAARVPWWSRWLPPRAVAFAERYLGARSEDLNILGMSGPELAGRKAALALCGLLAPPVLGAVLLVDGVDVMGLLPALAGVGLGVLGWTAPSRRVAVRAAEAREEFLAALTAFLGLVGLERQARGSPTEALEEASRISGAWPFRMIHAELLRAELAGQQPWDGLRDLGQRVGVAQLANLADIVAAAADGAAVFETLLAEARNLRNAELSDQQAQAGVAGERMTLPAIVLAFGFIMLVLYPALTRF
ncbi:MAG: secretion system protein F [Actinomycetota bacterium]